MAQGVCLSVGLNLWWLCRCHCAKSSQSVQSNYLWREEDNWKKFLKHQSVMLSLFCACTSNHTSYPPRLKNWNKVLLLWWMQGQSPQEGGESPQSIWLTVNRYEFVHSVACVFHLHPWKHKDPCSYIYRSKYWQHLEEQKKTLAGSSARDPPQIRSGCQKGTFVLLMLRR